MATQKSQEEFISDLGNAMLSALKPAHRMIMAMVENRTIDFNSLENYMGSVIDLVNITSLKGTLIDVALEDLALEWPDIKPCEPEEE